MPSEDKDRPVNVTDTELLKKVILKGPAAQSAKAAPTTATGDLGRLFTRG